MDWLLSLPLGFLVALALAAGVLLCALLPGCADEDGPEVGPAPASSEEGPPASFCQGWGLVWCQSLERCGQPRPGCADEQAARCAQEPGWSPSAACRAALTSAPCPSLSWPPVCR